MLRWLLLPTAVRASNAWHTDENCGCHNLNSAWGIRTMFERGYNASLAHRATDLKTLKDKSKQTKSEKKLRQALTYELWRSLRAYRTQQISTREEAEQEVVKAKMAEKLAGLNRSFKSVLTQLIEQPAKLASKGPNAPLMIME